MAEDEEIAEIVEEVEEIEEEVEISVLDALKEVSVVASKRGRWFCPFTHLSFLYLGSKKGTHSRWPQEGTS